MASPSLLHRIALPYRLFFLYIEPILALFGTYLCHADPQRFLSGTVPQPAYLAASPIDVSPLLQMQLTNIAALYLLFAISEFIVLRCTREKSVWNAVLAGMLASDAGHLYAVYKIAPERALMLGSWSGDEWINYGTLVFGACMRIAFLLGVGVV
jgi:hypothetical protein